MENVGLQALFDDKDFQAGLKRYAAGIGEANTVTDKGAGLMTTLGAVASGALVAGLAAGAVALAGFIAISKTGLDATLSWANDLDRLGDQFGLSGADASKWAVAMQHVGLTVDEGAQGLNFFTRGLSETSKTAKDGSKTLTPFGEALKKLGVSAYDSKGKLKDFDTIMPQMMDAFKKLPAGVDSSALAMDLFGARGGTKFLDFLRQGSKGLADADAFAKEFGLTVGSNAVDAAEQFGFSMNDLNLAVKGIWNQVGTALLPIVKELTEYITKNVLPVFAQWAKENAPRITEALRALGTWFMQEGVPAIKQFAGWVVNTLIPALKQLWDFVQKNVLPVIQKFVKMFQDDMPKAQKSTQDSMQKIWKAVQDVWRIISPILSSIFKELSKFWTEIQPKLERAWDNIQKATKEAWDAIWKIIKPVVEAIQKWIEDHMDEIQQVMNGVWKEIEGVVKVAWATISGIIKIALDIIGGDFEGAAADWKQMQRDTWAGIQQIISGAWNIIKGIFSAALQTLVQIINDRYNDMVNAIRNLMNGVVSGISSMLNSVTSAMFNLIQAAIGVIGTFAGNAVSAGVSFISNVATGIANGVGSLISAVSNAISTAVTWLWLRVSSAVGDMIDAGRALIQGIIDGLGQMAGSLASALWNVVSGAVRSLLNALGIHSPSRLMMAIGANMAESLAMGFGVPQLDFAISPLLAGAGMSVSRAGAGAASFSSSVVNNFNLSIQSAAPVSTVTADFGILRSLAQ